MNARVNSVSRSTATARTRCPLAAPLVALLLATFALAVPASAAVPPESAPPSGGPVAPGARPEKLSGHLSIGYERLFADAAPGGSFAVAAGLDHSVTSDWKAGVTVGYALLGSRNLQRGSLYAGVDYSVLEAVAFAHWQPRGLGPVNRISLGPGLFSAHADLVAAAGGAAFSDLAREAVAPGLALDVTLMRRKPAPVKVGLELGTRLAFLPQETWILAGARVVFHY